MATPSWAEGAENTNTYPWRPRRKRFNPQCAWDAGCALFNQGQNTIGVPVNTYFLTVPEPPQTTRGDASGRRRVPLPRTGEPKMLITSARAAGSLPGMLGD